jgi:hypothetical protein
MPERFYKTFIEFYPYYLTEHSLPVNRSLHFIGTALVIGLMIAGLTTGVWYYYAFMPICGYGFAWVGHFFVEKNKPATFTYPLYSLASDFLMFWHILTGQIGSKLAEAKRNIKN